MKYFHFEDAYFRCSYNIFHVYILQHLGGNFFIMRQYLVRYSVNEIVR